MDSRDRAAATERWYTAINRGRMTATLRDLTGESDDTREIPVRFEVCPTCQGRGTHVNPSIDAHGLSADDFAEDPGFAEDYFGGTYDVECYECNGDRVVPVPTNEGDARAIADFEHDEAAYADEVEAERRMGC